MTMSPMMLQSQTTKIKMEKALAKGGVRILGMDQAHCGNAGTYCMEITLGFTEGTTPFLINPVKLLKQFWTGLGNRRQVWYLTYKWPTKCHICESEAHLTARCPWPNVEIFEGRKPNLFNCRFHGPGWEELLKGPRKPVADARGMGFPCRPHKYVVELH